MTVIAWDGRTISADKRMSIGSLVRTTTKLYLVGAEAVAFCGDADTGLAMLEWYKAGADPAKFPEGQKDDQRWSSLVIAGKDGIGMYERTPHMIRCEDKLFACGSGREYALAAMHCGKNTQEAVEIASLFDSSCGNGVDTLTFTNC